MKKIYRSLASISLGWLIGSCGDGPTAPPPPTTAAITMSAAATTLVPTETVQLVAIARDKSGQALPRVFAWSTSDDSKAKVSSTGVVTGVAPGTATVTAAADGKSATTTISILEGGVVSSVGATLQSSNGIVQIVVPPDALVAPTSVSFAPSTTVAGDPRVVKGTAFDFGPNGTSFAKPITISIKYDPANVPAGTEEGALQIQLAKTPGWQAMTSSVVDVGKKVVTAQVSHFSTYAILTPTPVAAVAIQGPPEKPIGNGTLSLIAGESIQLTATVTDSEGQIVSNRHVSWVSSDVATATVSENGLVTAVKAGTATVSASAGGVSASVAANIAPVPVAAVKIDPASASIVAGSTQQLAVTLTDAGNNALGGRVVDWSSSDNAVATVGSSGLVTGVSPGTATITATSEGKVGTSAITVVPIPVASVAVTLVPTSISAVESAQASAVTLDADGHVLTGRNVVWSSSNTGVATVSESGVVTGVSAGTAQITASSEGQSGSAPITVTPAPVASISVSLAASSISGGQTTEATATLRDSQGHVLGDRPINWSSDNPGVATVDVTTGVVTAVAVGTANITATSEGKTGSASIAVTAMPIARVTVALNPSSITLIETSQATASVFDANGGVLTGRNIVWSSNDPSIATVSASGVVTAVSIGTVQITATSEGVAGSAVITVTQASVATVSVSLAASPITSVETTQATATLRDANGGALTGRSIAWASSNEAVATVSSSGIVTAIAAGTAQITATSEGKSGSATITVTPAAVATVIVSPAASTVIQGETQQFSAELKDANNSVLTGRVVTWSSSNEAVATVSTTGLVTAVAVGSATITATSEGKSGTSSITVRPIPVATVTVALTPSSVTAVGNSQATATTRDANGGVLTGRTVTWSSDNNAVATVNATTGAIAAISVGTANIIATSEGKTGSATLTVTQAPVATVSVSLAASSITTAETTQATATLRDSQGRVLTGRSISWSSDAPAVATVNPSTGLLTAVAEGTAHITATSEGQSGNASINVTPIPVATVTVSPASASVVQGQTQQLTAETRDAGNNVLTGRTVTWSSTDNGVATVNSTGLVTAVSVGSATITATSEGKSGTSSITVTPIPVATVNVVLTPNSITAVGTSQATATTLSGSGQVLTGRVVTWSSDNNAVATVNASTGVVTAISVGTANVIATSEGKTGSATLTVTQAPVATVTVSLVAASITTVETTQATAVLRDSQGRVLTGRSVTWSSESPSIATVSSTGLVTPVSTGTANITATSEGQGGSAAVTVTAAPVASVAVSLTPNSITAVGISQATATTRDANGGVLSGRSITWSSDNTAVATVNATTGAVTGITVGTASITATSEGKTGSATLTVTQAPVATVSVSLAASSISTAETTQATATLRDSQGRLLSGRLVGWSSDNTAVATVNSATGLVTAVSAGSANIVATSEGKTGTASISVTPVPVARVTVSPATASVTQGQTQQLTAETRDAGNNVLTGRALTWSSSNDAVATVNGSGLVTAVATGSATITATSEGKLGTSSITVTPIPVATVTVSLAPSSITAVGTSQATATTRDANSGVLTGRTVTWTSDNTAVATVDAATGAVTGISVGTAQITATSEGKTGSATLTVTQAPVATVDVSLAASSITTVETTQATATLRDSQSRLLTGRSISWSSDAPSIATVNVTTGLVTAASPGTAHLTATSEGQSGSAAITVIPVPVASVSVSLGSASIVVGGSTQATATTRDASNNVLTGRAIAWSSDNTGVATVSSTGVVTAVAAGSANILATSEGITGSTSITATPIPVATVTVSPASASVVQGATQQLTAETRDAGNNVLAGRLVTWSSSDNGVATVNASGLVTAVATGSATITATSEGKTGTSSITVTPTPVATVNVALNPNSITAVGTSQATATTLGGSGQVLTDRAVTWSSDNTTVATVNATTGAVSGVSVGTANIIATSEGKTGSAALTVTQAPVATVSVSLAASSITAIETTQATATLRDSQGRLLSARSVTWSSDNTAIATVNPTTGLVTAVSAGSAHITATSEGQSGSATLTVTPAPVASVSVSLGSSSIVAGSSTQATATTRDASNNVLTGRVVTWSSDNTAVATVSSTGLVTAVAAGSANIIATSEGKSGSASLTVTPVPVASVTVSPSSASIVQGQTHQLSAETRDAGNNVLTGRVVTWSSSNEAVARVSTTGLVTAVAVGTATITATSEGKSGTSSITVTPIPVATVTVALAPSSITAVGTSQATATTRDANGGVLTGRTVTWSSDNTAVATVNATTGAITAISVGTANIIATSEGKTGSATLTVTQAPVATITVSLAATSITTAETTQASAVLRDSQGRVLTGRSITWSSDNTAVATVNSATGLVSAVANGTASIIATSEGTIGSASITVTPAPVASVSVSLTPNSITAVGTSQATATTRDANGGVLTGRTVTWSSDNTAVATVNTTTGAITAISVGTANIIATSEGKTGTATLTVTQAPVATVSVSLATSSITTAETTQATATLRDSQGRILTGRSISWSSDNTAAATVNSTNGLVSGVSAGSANIVATSEGKSGSASITVTPVPVASVTVSPSSATVIQGQTQQLTSETRDAGNNILTGRAVTWSSSDNAVATVNSTGLVTAVAVGGATITATSEGKTGTSSITVTPIPVATVNVVLTPNSITAVGTSQATATTLGGSGQVLTGRTVTWSSDNTAVATVDATTGAVTGISVGTANIIGTSEGKTGSATLTVTQAPVATVSVSLAASSITTVQTTQATATLRDSQSRLLSGRLVTWSSDNTAVAIVNSSTGLVTAVSAGTANIIATSEGKSGSATITITPVPVATVAVSPASASVVQGQTQQLTAETRDAGNNVLTGRVVTWSSSNEAAATVSTNGLVTAIAVGGATITATSEGKTGTSSITVTPIPVATVTVALAPSSITAVGTSQATATTRDANGQVLTGRTVTWNSDNTAVATVNATTGVVTAVSVGTANIIATSEGKTGSATLTVTQAPVATVSVSLAATSITTIETTQATAILRDSQNRILSGRAVTWASDNAAVATVDAATGLVTAVAVGAAHITATSEGQSGSATLTVTPAPVATVSVSLAASSVEAGQTTQATATTFDANHNVLTGRVVAWNSDNTAVATVSGSGLVTAVSAGSANITATSEGKTGSAAITVTPVPVATVTVNPASASVVQGQTQQLSAETRDGGDNVLTGRVVTWSSSNEAVATVSATGLVTAVAVGSATITATSEGKSGTSSITVTPIPVATVTVSLAPSSITAVGTSQATATTRDANGGVLTGRSITWSSDNTAVATVDATGAVTGISVGTASIIATSEGKTGSATLTVSQAPVASVTVTPVSPSVVVGSSVQLDATLKDARNRVLTGRAVAWSSSDEAVALVNGASGLVTGNSAGSATITALSEGVSGTSLVTVTAPVSTASLLHRSTRNPRYFENASNEVVYLTGSHTWSNLQDNGTVDPPPAFDYGAYLDFLTSHGHNFFRLWAWEQSKWTAEISQDYWITPGPFARTGPGNALDGKPKFDLTQFNQAYFDRLRQRVIDAGARGIYVSVMLFDGWSVSTKGGAADNNPWLGHPLNGANNVNGINGDTNGDGSGLESQTLGNASVTAIQDAYVRRVIDAVGDLDNVLYEIDNEGDATSKAWQYHMIQLIRDYEATRPKQHPIGMTPMWPGGVDSDVFASDADWVSINQNERLDLPPTANGSKVVIADTDHICGICGNTDWVWKSFTKGQNPILMDGYDGAAIGLGASDYNAADPKWEQIRTNLGYARSYARRMDLANAVPHGDLVNSESIGYCLAKPGSEYLVYVPSAGSVTLNLSSVTGTLNVEWFNPATGAVTIAGTVSGGPAQTLTAPFSGPAILFLH